MNESTRYALVELASHARYLADEWQRAGNAMDEDGPRQYCHGQGDAYVNMADRLDNIIVKHGAER